MNSVAETIAFAASALFLLAPHSRIIEILFALPVHGTVLQVPDVSLADFDIANFSDRMVAIAHATVVLTLGSISYAHQTLNVVDATLPEVGIRNASFIRRRR